MNAAERLDDIERRQAAVTQPLDHGPFLLVEKDVPALVAALRAVLTLARRDLDESPDYEERLWEQGFNAALDDATAAITAALDGTR